MTNNKKDKINGMYMTNIHFRTNNDYIFLERKPAMNTLNAWTYVSSDMQINKSYKKHEKGKPLAHPQGVTLHLSIN